MKTKKAVSILVVLVLIITSISVISHTSTRAADYEVTYVSDPYSDSGYNVHTFKVNGYDAWCVNFSKGNPSEGDAYESVSSVSDPGSMLYKVLYYGYNGPGFETFKATQPQRTDAWWIIQTTCLASHYYTNGTDPADVSGFELYRYLNDEDTPAPPSRTAYFSPDSVTATVRIINNKAIQMTDIVTFNADSRITVTLSLDSDVTLYFRGDSTPHTGNVTVRGGDEFYLSAPTTKNGDITINATDSSNQIFDVNIMNISGNNTSIQSLAVRIPVPVTASLQADFTAFGEIELYKSSGNPSVSNGNSCYSLNGAVYSIYSSQSDASNRTNPVAAITTNDAGYGKSSKLAVGTYYVRETTAPSGYAIDDTVYTVAVGADAATRLDVTDSPDMDPVSVLLSKEGNNGEALEGAEFEFLFYSGSPQLTDPALENKTPERRWVFKTDADGNIVLDNAHKIQGDDFYYNESGNPSLPLGTLTIRETKAPEGYLTDNTVHVVPVRYDRTSPYVVTYNAPTLTNNAITGVISIDKQGEKRIYNETTKQFETTMAALEGIKFGIYQGDTLVETITTDSEGKALSGELALGTYTVKEINTPGEYIKADDITVTFNSNDSLVDVNGRDVILKKYEVVNKIRIPDVHTTASDTVTGTRQGTIGEKTRIKDTVKATELVAGKEYKISGTVVNKKTGLPLVIDGKQVSAEKTFIADASDMDVDVIFDIDSTKLMGETVVCFEYLYCDDILIALHADLTDEGQTIDYPDIHTTAKDSVNLGNTTTVSEETTIIDTVELTNLIKGNEYTLKGTAYNPETGEQFMVDGKPLESSVTFVANAESCSVDVAFTFDSASLFDKKLVFCETLYYGDKVIAAHADLTDKDQTITFLSGPPHTGDNTPVAIFLILGIASLVGIAFIIFKKVSDR